MFDAFDSHGRLVRRRVFVCPEAADLKALDAWSGLRTVLAVETIRGVNGSGKVEAEIRYFLSSCRDDPTVLVQAIRRHWAIENGLHWVLDVTFREDDSRVRGSSQPGHSAQDRHQPHGPGPITPDQHAGAAQAGRLER